MIVGPLHSYRCVATHYFRLQCVIPTHPAARRCGQKCCGTPNTTHHRLHTADKQTSGALQPNNNTKTMDALLEFTHVLYLDFSYLDCSHVCIMISQRQAVISSGASNRTLCKSGDNDVDVLIVANQPRDHIGRTSGNSLEITSAGLQATA